MLAGSSRQTGGRSEVEVDLLRRLARRRALSRAELSRDLGVMRSTTSKIVRRLLDEGIIDAVDDMVAGGSRSVGRPGERIALAADHVHFLGAEVGVGYVRALRTDLRGVVRASAVERIDIAEQMPDATVEACARMIAQCAQGSPGLGGLAIALPGIVRPDGFVIRLPRIGWRDVDFGKRIRPRVQQFGPLFLENDANAYATGQMIRLGLAERDLTVFVHLDSGIGGAVVDRGTFLTGQTGLAGEIGHMYVPSPHAGSEKPPVRLEDVAGLDAVLAAYAAATGGTATLAALEAAAERRTSAAMATMGTCVSALAPALANLTSLLNPGTIVLGGPLAGVVRHVHGDLVAEYTGLLMHGTPVPDIVLPQAPEDAVALGCADLTRMRFLTGHIAGRHRHAI